MRLLVTGARGLLGTELVRSADRAGLDAVGVGREELDITDGDAIERTFADVRPDVVVNSAAFTHVDGAEARPDEAMAVNRDAARELAAASVRHGARFVHVSTDYVFCGPHREPIAPDADPQPCSTYGRTKLEGERAVLAAAPDAMIARTSWLYGAPKISFLTAMIAKAEQGERLRIVDDQIGCPTWTANASRTLLDLIAVGASGICHVTDRGSCSKAELTREALRLRGLETEVVSVTSAEWGAPAERPTYSVLDVAETERLLGRRMIDWREALSTFLNDSGGS